MQTGTSSPLSFFSFTNPAVKLRHLASTTAPLFSRFTEGCKQRFFRLVSPNPLKSSLWPSCSSRYFIRALSSANAFSISDMVPGHHQIAAGNSATCKALTRAVNQLSVLWIILLICYNQRQKRNSLSCSRRHLQDTVTSCIEGF
jgi:hypothetical protein